MSHDAEEVSRQQTLETYNHEMVTSEDFYVSELESLITHIVNPLEKSASRCHIKNEKEIDFVFGIIKHLKEFHIQLLRLIRNELSVIDTFSTYIGFVQLYSDYFVRYNSIIDTVASWSKSMEFREFISLRLNNEQCQKYIDNRLCSIPWYLFRPFKRIKEYYTFIKDLSKFTKQSDAEYPKLLKIKSKLKPLHDKIRRREGRYIRKTRLLEIQFGIFDNPDPIVVDRRYFVYNRQCQIKLSGYGKKYKNIQLYIFNDALLWCSKRGQFKQAFNFKHTNLIYGVPDASTDCNATLFIQYGGTKKQRKSYSKKKKRKSKSVANRISMSLSKSVVQSVVDEKDCDSPFDMIQSMEMNHGKPTKKFILVFVNEQARNLCLEKIKTSHSKFVKKMQENKEKNFHFDKNKLSIRGSCDDFDSMTKSDFSHSAESSFFGYDSHIHINDPKPMEISQKYKLPTPTHSNVSSTQITLSVTEDFMHSDSSYSETQSIDSKSSKSMLLNMNTPNHSNNSSLSACALEINQITKLKQSVSTREITTIQEENEEDVKSGSDHE